MSNTTVVNTNKTIIFMCHAESTENIKIHNLVEGVYRLQNLQLPLLQQVTSGISLLRYELNAPISDLGRQQINDASSYVIGCDFVKRFDVELITYSPLLRAKDTCVSVFSKNPSIELEYLREATPYEQLIRSTSVYKRIQQFEEWLSHIDANRIIVVGHSRFFKLLLKTENLMRNCDIWRANVCISSATGQTTYQWTAPELLFRSSLSKPSTFEKPAIMTTNPNTSEENSCRICQVSKCEMK